MSLITLTTDFGARDTFVGQIKGVILTIAPDVRIVDITHRIPPQNIMAGALAIESAMGAFPMGAIHMAIVDPGVGTRRAAIALETTTGFLVGPDN
ncbi:MAG: SAM-dependent chlorinase/fluorinase, partial [Pirellulaceae bacterium]|nr:SAM-dependent chlorinase/fluorinase [Pirellulaceae bacterium]